MSQRTIMITPDSWAEVMEHLRRLTAGQKPQARKPRRKLRKPVIVTTLRKRRIGESAALSVNCDSSQKAQANANP